MTIKSQRTENILRRQVFPIPANVAPDGTRCLMVNIPDDDEHEAIFMGAIDLLCKWNSWQRDGTDNARQASEVWKRAIYDHPMFRACGDEKTVIIDELEYQMSICEQLRFENGKLQALCCGEWTDIPGQGDQSLGDPSQPGEGAHQAGPGEEACYSGRLAGGGKWYVPTIVNTGDVITISDLKGSWYDGSFSAWRCGDGNLFFGGACIPTTYTDGADPLPSTPHMSLIAKIGSTFYPIYPGGSFTVPGGVTDSDVTLQANDSVLTDNDGEISFKACVANNQAGTFSHPFKLNLNPEGWTVIGAAGVYTAGVGFEESLDGPDGFGHYFRSLHIRRTFSTRTLTKVRAKVNVTKGSTLDSSAYLIEFYTPSTMLYQVSYAAGSNGVQSPEWTGSGSANQLDLQMLVGIGNSDPGGDSIAIEVLVEGEGSDPF